MPTSSSSINYSPLETADKLDATSSEVKLMGNDARPQPTTCTTSSSRNVDEPTSKRQGLAGFFVFLLSLFVWALLLLSITNKKASTVAPSLPGTKQVTPSSTDVTISICEPCQAAGITDAMVTKSRTAVGNVQRWHDILHNRQNKIKVAVLGGSVTAGRDCDPNRQGHNNSTCAWPHRMDTLFQREWWPGRHLPQIEIVNLGRGGVSSRTGTPMVAQLVDYDAVIFHWTANDDNIENFYKSDPKRIATAFETVVRTALALPRRPAVMILEGLGRRRDHADAEWMHYTVAAACEIPVVSARAAFWDFQPFHEEIFAYEGVHPPAVWHERYACLMYEVWRKEAVSRLEMTTTDWHDPVDDPPIFGGTTLRCTNTFEASAFSHTLEHAPVTVKDWMYYADVPEKYGFITNTSGAVLQFTLTPNKEKKRSILIVHYLQSYSAEWGTAELVVGNGKGVVIDSRIDLQESQLAEVRLELKDRDPTEVTIRCVKGKMKIVEVLLMACDA